MINDNESSLRVSQAGGPGQLVQVSWHRPDLVCKESKAKHLLPVSQ